jgi:hypothetical protein
MWCEVPRSVLRVVRGTEFLIFSNVNSALCETQFYFVTFLGYISYLERRIQLV